MSATSSPIPFVIPRLNPARHFISLGDRLADDKTPQLWFQVRIFNGQLQVYLMKVRHLSSKPRQVNHEKCSPYVVIQLTPNASSAVQSKVKNDTNEPNFNEIFTFEIKPSELTNSTLHFAAIDHRTDRGHQLIGHCSYALKGLMSKSKLWQPSDDDGFRSSLELCDPVVIKCELQQQQVSSTALWHVTCCHFPSLELVVISVNELTGNCDCDDGIKMKIRCHQGVKYLSDSKTVSSCERGSQQLCQNFKFHVSNESWRSTEIVLHLMKSKENTRTVISCIGSNSSSNSCQSMVRIVKDAGESDRFTSSWFITDLL